MVYFHSSTIPEYKTRPLIGEKISKGITGSTSYYIKNFQAKEVPDIVEDSKAIFQLFEKGLLLIVFKNTKSISVPIAFSDVESIELVHGEETINPIPLAPMWILLKLGVPVYIARYFRIRYWEYMIDPTVLNIKAQSLSARLETNGYTFLSQERFFSRLQNISSLKIKKPAHN